MGQRAPRQHSGTRRSVAAAAGAALGSAVLGLACVPVQHDRRGEDRMPDQPVRLTYMHEWGPNQGHGPATDQLVARFSQENPAIQVASVYSAEYFVKLEAMLSAGDPPDVATYNLAYLPKLVKLGAVAPAETLARGSPGLDLNDLVPAAREMVTFAGQAVALPYIVNTSGLAYNQTLFRLSGLDPARPPAMWAELLEQARQITGRRGDDQVWGTVFPRGTADPIAPLLAFIWQNGGRLIDEARRVILWNGPAAVEALQFQVDLVQRHRVAGYPEPANGEQGNVGIWHVPPGTVSRLARRVGDAFEWSTAHLPRGIQAATTIGGHCLCVIKTNRHHEAAWRFVRWFTTPPVEAEFLVASTTLPPWRAAEQQPLWQQFVRDEPRIRPFVEMLAYARPTPRLSRWQDMVGILAAERDAAAAGQKTAQQALDDAARQAAPLVDEG